jgi:hypothetical protein
MRRLSGLEQINLENNDILKAQLWNIDNVEITNDQVLTCIEEAKKAERKLSRGGKPLTKPKDETPIEIPVAPPTNSQNPLVKKKLNAGYTGPLRVVGGPKYLTSSSKVSKSFSNLHAHFGVRLQTDIYAVAPADQNEIGSPLANRIQARIGETVIPQVENKGYFGKRHVCSKLNLAMQKVDTLFTFVKHTETNTSLTLSSDAQLPNGVGWAIKDVTLYTCDCPRDCATCSDARTCLTCKNPSITPGVDGRCQRAKAKKSSTRRSKTQQVTTNTNTSTDSNTNTNTNINTNAGANININTNPNTIADATPAIETKI